MPKVEHPYGKHPVYLQMDHDLWSALNAYKAQLGVPRSRIIFDILRGFLGPLVASGQLGNAGELDDLLK